MPVPKTNKRKVLFDAVSKEYNLGTYEEFDQKLNSPEKRKVLYNTVGQKYNLGTYDEFDAKIGAVEKKSEVENAKPISEDLSQPAKVQEPLSGGLGTSNFEQYFEKIAKPPVEKPLPTGLLVEGKDSGTPLVNNAVAKPITAQDLIKQSLKTPVSPIDNTVIDLGLNTNGKDIVEKERISSEEDQKEMDEKAEAEYKKLDNSVGGASNFVAHIDQAFYGLPATVLETIAIGANQISRLNELGGGERVATEDQPTYKLAKWYRESLAEIAPTNPAMQDDLNSKVGTALGDLSALVISGGTSRIPKAVNELAQFTKASNVFVTGAKEAGKLLSTPPALVGAMQMGTNEFKTAKGAGASDDEAFDAFIKNAGVGSVLEAIPVMKFFKRLDNTTGGGVKKIIAKGSVQGVEEMTTEVAQQMYSNVNAANTYDTTRKWYDGMVESGGIGFGLGFFLGGMGTSLRKKHSEAKTPEEKAQIQKAIDFVEEKGAELKTQQENIDNKVNENANTKEVDTSGETTENIPEQQVPVSEEIVSDSQPVNAGTEIIQGTDQGSQQDVVIPEQKVSDSEGISIAVDKEVEKKIIEPAQQISVKSVSKKERKTILSQERVTPSAMARGWLLDGGKLRSSQSLENKEKGVGIGKGVREETGMGGREIKGLLGVFDNKNGLSVEDAAHKIWENLDEASQEKHTTQDIRNALIDVISSENRKDWLGNQKSEHGVGKYDEWSYGQLSDDERSLVDDWVGTDTYNEEFEKNKATLAKEYDEYLDSEEHQAYLNDTTNDTGRESTQNVEDQEDQRDIEQEGESSEASNQETARKKVIDSGVPPIVPVESTQEKDVPKKERQATKKLLEDETLSDDTKKEVSDFAKFYDPETHEMSNDQASAMIEKLGMDKAKIVSLDMNNGLPPMARTKLRKQLIFMFDDLAIKAKKKGDKVGYEKNKSNAKDLVEARGIRGTELGKELSAYHDPNQDKSASEIIHETEAEVKKQADEKLKEAESTLENIKKVIEGSNKETIEQILDIPKIRELLIEKSDKVKGTSKKRAVKKAIDKLDGLIAKLEAESKGKAFDAIYGLSLEAAKAILKAVKGALQAGYTISQAIDRSFNDHKRKNKNVSFDESGFKNLVREELKGEEVVLDPEKATKQGLEDLDIDIKDLIKKHYTEVEKTKRTLVDKLVSDSGLNEVDAKEVAKNIEQEFDRLSTKTKEQELKKLRTIKDKTVDKKKVDQLHEKIIKQSNLGALSDQELRDIYADKMGLPKLTEEQSKKLEDLAEKVQTSKDGFQKRRAIEELLKFQDSIKGINWMDVTTSIWYANILSGFSTQEINFFANMVETVGEFHTAAVYQPKNIPFMLKGLYEGYGRGILEAWDTLKTGYSPIKSQKIDTPNIMERVKFKGGTWNPLNYYKYVKRLMDAADIFAFHGIREMRAYEMAAMEARKQGKENPDQKIWASVTEKLFKTKERVIKAKAQAQEEGLKGNDYKRRVMELMDESRPVEMKEDMDNIAARGTFNFDPEGSLGFVSNQIAGIVEKVQYKYFKPLKFVVPFTRIVSNVANRYLDWSLVGFYRAGRGQIGTFGSDNYKRKYTQEERAKEFIKATTGTLAMLTLYALSDPGDDDKPVFEITAEGTGDIKKNYELGNSGWQKYSIRIGKKWYSYMNTPLAIPMSIIGRMRDDEKYNGKSLEDTDATTRLGLAVFNNFQFVTDMTFLRGLGDFMGSFSNDNPNAAVSYFEKLTKTTVKGFVVPNLYSQSAKELQRIYSVPMKEAKGLYEAIIRDVPIANDGLNNMIDAFGDPIVTDTDRLTSDVKTDLAWNIVIKNNAWIGRVMKNSLVVYDPKTEQERGVTDKEYYKFSKIRGKLIKVSILENMEELKGMGKEEVKDEILEYKKNATKQAKEELFY